jgi:hypothetical protein
VAQHGLTVLALRRIAAARPLMAAEAPRELLHDATEALIGVFHPITPIKPHLGEGDTNQIQGVTLMGRMQTFRSHCKTAC